MVALLLVMSLPVHAEGTSETNVEVEAVTTFPTFKDVSSTHWAYESILLGVEKGYIKGFTDGTFRPNDSVTVAEFVKMLLLCLTEKDSEGNVVWSDKYLKLVPEWKRGGFDNPSNSFAQGSPWYKNYVTTAKNLFLFTDEYEGRFTEPLTRERAARLVDYMDQYFYGNISDTYADVAGPQVINDYLRVESYLQWDVTKVALRGIMTGNTKGNFNPKATISRAEAAKIFMLLADKSKRKPASVNLTGVPYSNVPFPGYDKQLLVFANAEMKKVYDALEAAQSDYMGVTDAYIGTLLYAENDVNKNKVFQKRFYWDYTDANNYFDVVFSFTSNVYGLNLSIVEGASERAYQPINQFSSLVFNNPKVVKNLIDDSLDADRKGIKVEINKTIENRQVLISSTGRGFLSIGISAFPDKK